MGDQSNDVLSDLRRLNLLDAASQSYQQSSVGRGGGQQQQQQQKYQQNTNYEWNRVGKQNDSAVDVEAEELAAALESALDDGGQQQPIMYPPPGQGYYPQPGVPPPVPMGYNPNMGGGGLIPRGFIYTEGMRLPNSLRMKGWELAMLIKTHQASVRSGADFDDDFYNLKLREKHAKAGYGHQQQSQHTRPTDLLAEMQALLQSDGSVRQINANTHGPLPVQELPGFQSNLSNAILESKEKHRGEWHSSNQVLGKSVKSNLKRPRELIASQKSIGGSGFKTPQWMLRGILGKIADKLLEIEDVHMLLEAKLGSIRYAGAQTNSIGYTAGEEIVRDLQQKQITLCNRLGELLGFPTVIDSQTGALQEDAQVELVGGWDALFFLIWSPKGRRLVLRALPCLLRPHLRSFLKIFCQYCAYFVCRNPDGQDEEPVTDEEAKLDLEASRVFSEEISQIKDMEFVTTCLSLTHDVFVQSPAVLRVFVHIPAGQDVIRALLQRGKTVSYDASTSTEAAGKWNEQSGKFYSIMQAAVANLEKEKH